MTGIIKTDQIQGAQSSTIAVPSGNNLTVGGTLGVTGALTASGGVLVPDDGDIGSATKTNAIEISSIGNLTFNLTNGSAQAIQNSNGSNIIYGSYTNHGINFRTNNTERVNITTSGLAQFKSSGISAGNQVFQVIDDGATLFQIRAEDGNISFPQAGAGIYLGVTAGTAANLLDDYEEGTWTGTWYGTGGTNDSATTGLKYVKIGKTVTVSGNTSSTINATGPLELRGLPFTADDDATGAVLYRYTTAASGQHTLVFYIGASQSKIEPYWAAGGNYDKLNSSDFNSSGRDMYFSITYKAQ